MHAVDAAVLAAAADVVGSNIAPLFGLLVPQPSYIIFYTYMFFFNDFKKRQQKIKVKRI
jgi:hypothetical protein